MKKNTHSLEPDKKKITTRSFRRIKDYQMVYLVS